MPIAYLGIGSNLGSREAHCERAIAFLIEQGITVTKRSSMIETNPWGVEDQPKFINMAIEIETSLVPEELLTLLKNIEAEIGRQPGLRWGPRMIDLDILLYDELILKTPDLDIPHPGIIEREFVLRPLAEIAPDKVHPVLGESIRALFQQYPRNS